MLCVVKACVSCLTTQSIYKAKKYQKYQLIHQPATQLPTPIRVIQRRRPMVNARLQNFFPRQIAFIA